jgi:hypothetical protein
MILGSEPGATSGPAGSLPRGSAVLVFRLLGIMTGRSPQTSETAVDVTIPLIDVGLFPRAELQLLRAVQHEGLPRVAAGERQVSA